MSDRDNITLPREVVQEALEALGEETAWFGPTPKGAAAITALRAALAAEQPKHPGYIIGSHWLETAYSRICAGEAEADVLRDIGLIREEAFLTGVQHLRHENERLHDELRQSSIDIARAKIERLREALESIAANACCDRCQEAALVAKAALRRED